MKLIKLFSIAILAFGITMVSCSDGEDGIDGKDGIDGIDGKDGQDGADGENGQDGQDGEDGQDGTDGQDGADGQDGENGVGFDELTQYGYITLEMEGKRVDDVLFQDSTSFKFTPIDPAELPINNNVNFGGNTYTFDIRRFLSVPDKNQDDTNSFVKIVFEITDPGENSQSIDFFNIQINEYAVVGDDNKYFVVDDNWPFFTPEDDDIIKDVIYDTTTKHLTFSFTFTIPALDNVTGNDLHISGEVDIIALEAL